MQPTGAPHSLASVLFADPLQADLVEDASEPACFADLDLDQIADLLVLGREQYHLLPYLYLPLDRPESVTFRQEVFSDLDRTALAQDVSSFSAEMGAMRACLAEAAKTQHRYQIRTWLLSAAATYVEAVTDLLDGLNTAPVGSRALQEFRDCLRNYVSSASFQELLRDMAAARGALSEVRYSLLFYGNVIRIRRFQEEPDYGAQISSFFERFRQKDEDLKPVDRSGPKVRNRLEEQVLDRVAALFPVAFEALDAFCDAHPAWIDELATRFEREVQFYLAWLDILDRLRARALPVCFPVVSTSSRSEAVTSTYDLALALRLPPDAGPSSNRGPVTNDYRLTSKERTLVVTGPNQGGKTTFARAIGQIHWLASLGCPVPAARARLRLSDHVFTHFERAENIEDMRGKLADDLVRVHSIVEQATAHSLVILNEIFASTTLRDATVLSRAILTDLAQAGALVICVTFLDELSRFDESTVSMVAGVDALDPTVRTFRLERRPADGTAYAVLLAERYGLSRPRIKERLTP